MILNKRQQNKIRTPGYFIKRLKDCGYGVLRMFQQYAEHDPRRWTVLVDPGKSSIYITCYTNKDFNNEIMFEFNDGGLYFPKNYSINTESIEIIVQQLVDRGIQPIKEGDPFYAKKTK